MVISARHEAYFLSSVLLIIYEGTFLESCIIPLVPLIMSLSGLKASQPDLL